MSARFPQIKIEYGPVGAGVEMGDAIVFEPLPLVEVGVMTWPRASRFGMARPRQNLAVRGTRAVTYGPALRFVGHYESTYNAHGPQPTWSKQDELYTMSNFALRLLSDGPAIGVVRRFGERVLFQPRRLDVTLDDYRSTWTSFGEGKKLVDVTIIDRGNDVLQFEESERHAGIALETLIERCQGTLDAERALNIARQCAFEREWWTIGFDGVARGEGRGDGAPRDASALFSRLSAAAAEGAPAPNDAIAELVRALAPDEWARERQFVEEAALL